MLADISVVGLTDEEVGRQVRAVWTTDEEVGRQLTWGRQAARRAELERLSRTKLVSRIRALGGTPHRADGYDLCGQSGLVSILLWLEGLRGVPCVMAATR